MRTVYSTGSGVSSLRPDRVTTDGSRTVYEKDFGDTVTGYELNPATGKHDLPVSKVRVVVEPDGEIVTAFPQRDWKQ